MAEKILEINGEKYVHVDGLIDRVADFLIEGVSDYYINSSVDEDADEIVMFLISIGQKDLAEQFKKKYVAKRIQHLRMMLD